MKHFALLAATSALGYMSETAEVILATRKGSSDAVRVNKADFDADQEKDAGDREFAKYSGKDEPEQSAGVGAQAFADLEGVRVQAAPSAPDFSGGPGGPKPVIDEVKNAAAPTVPSLNSRLVMKDGSKFFVVNGMGTKLTGEAVGGDIDESGYKSEAAAKAAIALLPR